MGEFIDSVQACIIDYRFLEYSEIAEDASGLHDHLDDINEEIGRIKYLIKPLDPGDPQIRTFQTLLRGELRTIDIRRTSI